MGRAFKEKDEGAKNCLLALMNHDLPIPLKLLYQAYGRETTWYRRRQRGLTTYYTEGVGLTVRTADLREFLWKETREVPAAEKSAEIDPHSPGAGG